MGNIERLLTLMTGDEKHDPASYSTLDVIRVLYERVLDVSPEPSTTRGATGSCCRRGTARWPTTPCCATAGFFPESWLAGWASFDSPLGHHPDRNLVPGVEISSGSLGHGLPLAVGTALGLRAQGIDSRVVVLVGDAELDEGSNHEALELAAALGLDALTVVVVDNRSRLRRARAGSPSGSPTEGWHVATVDGRDHDALEKALSERGVGVPNAVVATVAARTRSGGMTDPDPRPATQFARTATDLLDEDLSTALVSPRSRPVLRRRRGAPPRPRGQRRHPRAAAGQRRRRPGADRDAADRAHLRHVPGRARLRAGQARLPPPGRRRRAGRVAAARSTRRTAAAPTRRRATSR